MAMRFYTISPGTETEQRVGIEPVAGSDSRYDVVLDPDTDESRKLEVDALTLGPGMLSILREGRSYDVDFHDAGDVVSLSSLGLSSFSAEVLDERMLRRRRQHGGRHNGHGPNLVVPMAGKVITITVNEGDTVEEGQGVAVVEAMKMENEITAHLSGVVQSIGLSAGDSVEPGAVLLTIEAGEDQ